MLLSNKAAVLFVCVLCYVTSAEVIGVQNGGDRVSPPAFPKQFEVSILYKMPYIGLEEPIVAVVDVEAKSQQLDFYGGMNQYYLYPSGESYEILPVIDHKECFASAQGSFKKLLPDLTGFQHSGTEDIDGVKCDVWFLNEKTLNITSAMIGKYYFYTDASTSLPVRFYFVGHNTVLGGSHQDEYEISYSKWKILTPDTVAPLLTLPAPHTPEACQSNTLRRAQHAQGFGSDEKEGGPLMARPFRDPVQDLVSIFPENHEQRVKEFDEYKQQFTKQYGDDKEHSQRHHLFHMNLRFIHSTNRKGLSYWLGINHLVDWTLAELKSLAGSETSHDNEDNEELEGINANYTYQPTTPENQLPKSINWTDMGAVTEVKDQGSCGSCWSFSTTGGLEGQLFRRTGKLVRLSEQELMDCSWEYHNNACNGGSVKRSFNWMLEQSGGTIASEESYGPYLNVPGWCHWKNATSAAKMNGFVKIEKGNLHSFNDALVAVGPLSVGIDATSTELYYYSGGLFNFPKCGKTLDHAVLAVGYITVKDQRYHIVKNSWSTHWGMDGYILVTEKHDDCGLAQGASYPLLTEHQPIEKDAVDSSVSKVLGSTVGSFRVNIKTTA